MHFLINNKWFFPRTVIHRSQSSMHVHIDTIAVSIRYISSHALISVLQRHCYLLKKKQKFFAVRFFRLLDTDVRVRRRFGRNKASSWIRAWFARIGNVPHRRGNTEACPVSSDARSSRRNLYFADSAIPLCVPGQRCALTSRNYGDCLDFSALPAFSRGHRARGERAERKRGSGGEGDGEIGRRRDFGAKTAKTVFTLITEETR